MHVLPFTIPNLNAFISIPHPCHWLSQKETPRDLRYLFPETALTLPQTTPTSNSSSSFGKYFPPLFLAQMPDLMDDSSYMPSRLKNTTTTRKVDCVVPTTFVCCHSNLKQKAAYRAWRKQHFTKRFRKTPGQAPATSSQHLASLHCKLWQALPVPVTFNNSG